MPTIEAYEQKKEIETLVITEGYLKAIRASKAGIHCIGLSGIFNITNGEGFFSDIPELIKACNVRKVCILWDADCRLISENDLHKMEVVTQRPKNFINAALKLKTYLSDSPVTVYFAHPVEACGFKGLDDLLNGVEHDQHPELVKELQNVGAPAKWFYKMALESKAETVLNDHFAIYQVNQFYAINEAIIQRNPFRFDYKYVYQFSIEQQCPELIEMDILPEGADPGEYLKFKHFTWQGCYWAVVKQKGGGVAYNQLTNFTMRPLYLIQGANPKRTIVIRNQAGKECLVDFEIRQLTSIQEFKAKVEANGWYQMPELNQRMLDWIKFKIFQEEKPAKPITYLGQQNAGFWAWANGIYSLEDGFIPADQEGMIEYKKHHYYIAASVADEDNQGNEQRFSFTESKMDFVRWSHAMHKAYKHNGLIAIAFATMALFRDLTMPVMQQFPLLFVFGQRGTGKTSMVQSLQKLFGQPQEAVSLEGSSTPKSIARKFEQFQNSLVFLDEFKNGIDKTKLGILKGLADGYSYSRAAMTQDAKTNDGVIRSSAIVGGQDMPVTEPAFFSRLILLGFAKANFTDTREHYEALRAMEDEGITSVTHELLQLRETFKQKFKPKFKEVLAIFRQAYGETIIERQLVFTSGLIATWAILCDYSQALPVSVLDFQKIAEQNMKQGSALSVNANEVKVFFDLIAFLHANNEIGLGKDIEVKDNVLWIRFVKLHPLYMEAHKKQYGRNGMERGTLSEYFKGESGYMGTKNIRFKDLDNATSAHGFSLDYLNDMNIDQFGIGPKAAQPHPQTELVF